MTIIDLIVENVKGVKAVRITPNGSPAVLLKGRNEAGKTSVIDAIWYAIGGERVIPPDPVRHGEKTARVVVTFDDIEVERRWTKGGENTYLEVRDREGNVQRPPQTILDALYSKISFDPLAFSRMPAKEQAELLKQLAGLDFTKLDDERKDAFDERTVVSRRVRDLEGRLRSMSPVSAPDKEEDPAALAQELADLAGRASGLREKRSMLETWRDGLRRQEGRIEALKRDLASAQEEAAKLTANVARFSREIEAISDVPSDEEIARRHRQIADIEETNRRVRAKRERATVAEQLRAEQGRVEALTATMERIDAERAKLLSEASLPIPGLQLEDERVLYRGVAMPQCSQAVNLRVSAAIGFKLNKKINIAFIRDGSLLDEQNLSTIAELAEAEHGQVLIERVGKDGRPGVIIEDGEVELVEEGAFADRRLDCDVEVDL
jgi:DNA repair exonuclease SbcCD ATPase subunit